MAPKRLLSLLIVILLGIIIFASGQWIIANAAQVDPTDYSQNQRQKPAIDRRIIPSGFFQDMQQVFVVKAIFLNRQMVDEIASRIDIWEINHDKGYLIAAVNSSDLVTLLEAGFKVEIDSNLSALINQPNRPLDNQVSGIPGFPCYRTVEETFQAAESMVASNPNLASWEDIGDSWEKATSGEDQGYDLRVLKLTNSAITGNKPRLMLTAVIHAREYATAELVTRFAEYLLSHYATDADITWLLDYHEIHLLLISNPDGRKFAESGLYWRKNVNQAYCSPTSSSRGADLNRNFDFRWGCCGGSSTNPCNETYRGPNPASEPETQVIQTYLRSIFPDQREPDIHAPAPSTASGLFLDIHSYGELILWPWGSTTIPSGNASAFATLGYKFAYFNHYDPAPSYNLYFTDGTTVDFAYGDLGVAAYTFELGNFFFENCSDFENTIFPDNLPGLIYAAKAAAQPYILPSGPDALSIIISPTVVTGAGRVELTAEIDDTRFYTPVGTEPVQAINSAEYYIDTPPWITPTQIISSTMSALDGLFDEEIEQVTAHISTDTLAPGQHIIFVRGQDANENWGVVSAKFFYIGNAVYIPVLMKE